LIFDNLNGLQKKLVAGQSFFRKQRDKAKMSP